MEVPGRVVGAAAAAGRAARVVAATVADADVEQAVLAELEVAGVVVAGRGRDVVDQDHLAAEGVPGHDEPGHPVHGGGAADRRPC